MQRIIGSGDALDVMLEIERRRKRPRGKIRPVARIRSLGIRLPQACGVLVLKRLDAAVSALHGHARRCAALAPIGKRRPDRLPEFIGARIHGHPKRLIDSPASGACWRALAFPERDLQAWRTRAGYG